MLDRQDNFTRWYQGVLGILIFIAAVFFAAVELRDLSSGPYTGWHHYYFGGLAITGFYISFQCLWYALTGEDNINRDDA